MTCQLPESNRQPFHHMSSSLITRPRLPSGVAKSMRSVCLSNRIMCTVYTETFLSKSALTWNNESPMYLRVLSVDLFLLETDHSRPGTAHKSCHFEDALSSCHLAITTGCLSNLLTSIRLLFQFIIEDMKQQQTNKHSNLHREDQHITVEELWRGWKTSEGLLYFFTVLLYYLKDILTNPCTETNISTH